jgi:hypothetical protein
MRRLWGGVLAAGLILLAPSATLAAKPKIKVPANSDVVQILEFSAQNPSVPVSIDVTCPPRTEIVGGGFSGGAAIRNDPMSPRRIVTDLIEILEARRLSLRTWRVTAVEVTNPETGGFGRFGSGSATAYCDSIPGRVTERSAVGATSTSNSAPSTATATCPRGRVAIAGGFSLTPGPGPGFAYPSVFENYRSGKRSWTASAAPYTQAQVQITSYAYCAKGDKPPPARSATKAASGSESPRCRDGLRAGAGGFRASPDVYIGSSEAIPTWPEGGPHPAMPKWITGQLEDQLEPFDPLTVFAYCS